MSDEFNIIFPIAIRVSAHTLANDLVTVAPIGGISDKEIERIQNEIKIENRDKKLNSILEGVPYVEMKPKDHPDWKGLPISKLFYMDYKYNSK